MRFYGLPLWTVLGLGGVAVATVLSLYTVRFRLPQRIVATTALWQKVTALRRGAGRLGSLEHLVSLLLQMMIALALVVAIGLPRLSCQSDAGRAIVLVLDRSASMGAIERVEARLEMARRRAVAVIESAAATDELSLVLTGDPPEVAVPLGRDPIGLRAAIAGARIQPGRGRLVEAVDAACRMIATGQRGRLVVVTDGSESIGSCANATIEPVLIGEPRPNVGVVAFGASTSPHDPLHASVYVQVMNSWNHDAQVELRVDLDGKLMQVAALNLPSGGTAQRTFDGLPLTGGGRLEARLTQIKFTEGGEDALHEDDRAYTVIAHRAVVPIDFIGTSEPMRLVLAANPRYQVTPRRTLAEARGAVQVVAGDAGAPLAAGRYLLIDPRGSGLPFTVGAPIADPQITAIAQDHPIMRRVVLSDVSIEEARKITLPASATAIVQAPQRTPIVFAQVDGAQRIAALSFDLGRSNLPLRVGFPVLVYNMIDWLLQQRSVDEDDPTLFRTQSAVRVSRPAGKPQLVSPEEGVVRVVPSEPGFYEIASPDGKVLRTFGVSVASREETRVQPRAQPKLGDRSTGMLRDRELSTWLWMGALALLLLEWFTYQRRVTV